MDTLTGLDNTPSEDGLNGEDASDQAANTENLDFDLTEVSSDLLPDFALTMQIEYGDDVSS